ncbi:hypothetical protein HOU08_gp274 [Dickeya phage vB_DsoM_JA29]|uniref:Uncharacterized protein n=1 Tax=Dickeya phage vB_DsoM_JA29 TaxID=2283031 RepID=A0A384ZXL7_9CAUD|nr:hypothetical protein HOU08_gp274 [Dickeya phage vB_DsoM_JA29]AXG67000.1 hypothetical protein JA29_274 [Dickeya phage vB_DsoM_JA29]
MQKVDLDLATKLAMVDDVSIDRLHHQLGFGYSNSRIDKVKQILLFPACEKVFALMRNYIANFDKPEKKEEKETFDPNIATQYAIHQSPVPLILYLRSYGLSTEEIQTQLHKYYAKAADRIPAISDIANIASWKEYQLDDKTYNWSYTQIYQVCKKYGLHDFHIFYDPLYFDQYHESQGGWGVTLSEKDRNVYGYGMIGGDTIEDAIHAVTHTVRKSRTKRQ